MVSPLLLLVHLLPLLLILFLCMKTRPPRAKTPSNKKKGQATPSIAPRTQISSGNKSITGRKIGSTVVGKSDVQSTMTAPIVVSGYLPGADTAKAPAPLEENPGKEFVKSTSFNEDKPIVVPPLVPSPQPLKNRPARSRTSRDKRKTLTDKGGSNELIQRTCEDPTLDEHTCEMKTKVSGRSIRPKADRVEYQEFTAINKEDKEDKPLRDGSLITCCAEEEFLNEKDKNEQIMGNVDEEMDSEWEDYIGEQLDSEVEHSCLQPTDKCASAVICGNKRIWLSNKIGSQADTPEGT
ncbi:hypothetical protein PRIPAC_88016 [Pristionchus pacificus]|uniref:Uncharacterized protein n=1 Tax=Pristionchus pacificus TaxID=54126 RepID=A0A2A6B6W7_PRIPA|nr:hypothetical protein PRIPAC_88016 [Pristionchus pacificus]|eukprot:PDM61617.1 hypothetical protein PRIPAC_51059 [Pristionchus pacificus]